MFFVLKSKETGDMLGRDSPDGHTVTTKDLQRAKLFKLALAVVTTVTGSHSSKTKELGKPVLCITCETTGKVAVSFDPPIPAGLPGNWEIVLIDLRLA